MARIMVTGGAGFIGSHTLVELLSNGHDVHVVDNFDNSSPIALDRVGELMQQKIEFSKVDIRDASALTDCFAAYKPDAIIHFAGLKAVGESKEKPIEYYNVNVSGSTNILSSMEAVGCRRIIFSSSATVYGEPQYLPLDEAHACAPQNVYGQTKYQVEQLLEAWQNTHADNCAVALRYFNPVGAHASARIGEDPAGIPNNLLPFVAKVAIGELAQVNVFGDDYDTPDGTGMRDYIHVVDLAKAHVAALEYALANATYEAINVGTGQDYSVLEIISAFSKAAGREIPYQITDRRPGDAARSVADVSKAKQLLGWQAEYGIEQMVLSGWAWQSQNPKGYEEG